MLHLPGLRASDGETITYTVTMTVKMLIANCTVMSDVTSPVSVGYHRDNLLRDKETVIPPFVVGLTDEGGADWIEYKFGSLFESNPEYSTGSDTHDETIAIRLESTLGVLVLTDEREMALMRGVNVLRGLQEAIIADKNIGLREVTVVCISGKKTDESAARIEKLAQRLNGIDD
jgi:hypothetical protein